MKVVLSKIYDEVLDDPTKKEKAATMNIFGSEHLYEIRLSLTQIFIALVTISLPHSTQSESHILNSCSILHACGKREREGNPWLLQLRIPSSLFSRLLKLLLFYSAWRFSLKRLQFHCRKTTSWLKKYARWLSLKCLEMMQGRGFSWSVSHLHKLVSVCAHELAKEMR